MPKATAERQRRLITGAGDPDEAYPVPEITGEFTPAPDLAEIGVLLMKKTLLLPEEVTVDFLWKLRGGKAAGKCIPLKGLAGYYGSADYAIWVAADQVDDLPYSRYMVEALLYHELKHIDVDQDEDGGVTLGSREHEIEAFRDEIELYGFWRQDRAAFGRVVQRMLPGWDGTNEIQDPPAVKRPGGEAGQPESRASAGGIVPDLGDVAERLRAAIDKSESGIDSVTFKSENAEVTITKADAAAFNTEYATKIEA